MGNLRLKGKDLKKIGFKSEITKSIAINIVSKYYKHNSKHEILEILKDVTMHPEQYLQHENLDILARILIGKPVVQEGKDVFLLSQAKDFCLFGKKNISAQTIAQMEKAMLLPVASYGALMPDAHEGYGLPIGGVFAAKDVVIPYGVGLDIGCRMSLTVFQEDSRFLKRYAFQLKQALRNHTHFGIKNDCHFHYDHEILERKEFSELTLAKKLHGKAIKQLGTSGSGNHFVEFGIAEFNDDNNFGITPGSYLALLSHSGSRGFGAEIAKHYTGIAMKQLRMPKGWQHLAWLDINSSAGMEYWALMNLAGDYAKANHDMIHLSIAKELGLSVQLEIGNHHNFAWKELIDGEEYLVHRKGATPAHQGVPGIIPGSMTQPGYIVTGKGESSALFSASHGAGRKLTRTKARNSITMSEVRKHLKQHAVTLIGGGVDESPFVYKDLEKVMSEQHDLVDIEGKFFPKIIRMDKS